MKIRLLAFVVLLTVGCGSDSHMSSWDLSDDASIDTAPDASEAGELGDAGAPHIRALSSFASAYDVIEIRAQRDGSCARVLMLNENPTNFESIEVTGANFGVREIALVPGPCDFDDDVRSPIQTSNEVIRVENAGGTVLLEENLATITIDLVLQFNNLPDWHVRGVNVAID